MKKTTIAAALTLAASFGLAGTAHAEKPTCNWGELTKNAIADPDWDQGAHSSDPSNDGHGPGTADEPRTGLGNVVGQGDLNATCEFIEGALGGG